MHETTSAPARFSIRVDWWCRPFLLFLAVTPDNAYLELTPEHLRIRFGPAFDRTIERATIVGATPISWSIFNGVGVRAGGRLYGVIGSLSGVVELTLSSPADLRFAGWPWTASRIAISLDNPQACIAALALPRA